MRRSEAVRTERSGFGAAGAFSAAETFSAGAGVSGDAAGVASGAGDALPASLTEGFFALAFPSTDAAVALPLFLAGAGAAAFMSVGSGAFFSDLSLGMQKCGELS
jgi:hypothetical protein